MYNFQERMDIYKDLWGSKCAKKLIIALQWSMTFKNVTPFNLTSDFRNMFFSKTDERMIYHRQYKWCFFYLDIIVSVLPIFRGRSYISRQTSVTFFVFCCLSVSMNTLNTMEENLTMDKSSVNNFFLFFMDIASVIIVSWTLPQS